MINQRLLPSEPSTAFMLFRRTCSSGSSRDLCQYPGSWWQSLHESPSVIAPLAPSMDTWAVWGFTARGAEGSFWVVSYPPTRFLFCFEKNLELCFWSVLIISAKYTDFGQWSGISRNSAQNVLNFSTKNNWIFSRHLVSCTQRAPLNVAWSIRARRVEEEKGTAGARLEESKGGRRERARFISRWPKMWPQDGGLKCYHNLKRNMWPQQWTSPQG